MKFTKTSIATVTAAAILLIGAPVAVSSTAHAATRPATSAGSDAQNAGPSGLPISKPAPSGTPAPKPTGTPGANGSNPWD